MTRQVSSQHLGGRPIRGQVSSWTKGSSGSAAGAALPRRSCLRLARAPDIPAGSRGNSINRMAQFYAGVRSAAFVVTPQRACPWCNRLSEEHQHGLIWAQDVVVIEPADASNKPVLRDDGDVVYHHAAARAKSATSIRCRPVPLPGKRPQPVAVPEISLKTLVFCLRAARDPTTRHGESQALPRAWLATGEPLLSRRRVVVLPCDLRPTTRNAMFHAALRRIASEVIVAFPKIRASQTSCPSAARGLIVPRWLGQSACVSAARLTIGDRLPS